MTTTTAAAAAADAAIITPTNTDAASSSADDTAADAATTKDGGGGAIFYWENIDSGKKYTQARQRAMAGDEGWTKKVVSSMKIRMIERLNSIGEHDIKNVMAYPIVNKNGVWMTVGLAYYKAKKTGIMTAAYKVQIWADGLLGEMEIVHDHNDNNHEVTGDIIHTFVKVR